ncbi:hypothetical protein CKAH01_06990 [Colletotrichum kahawae]|uniref:Uncharacterized protein n=1 Tax=Colletotrichum kahawae TaxID=34407 RepID=A0AAD9Y5W0_COLKA|nr:hypothetical protein CKAH01_06990 [Colletotrichum kahawae]
MSVLFAAQPSHGAGRHRLVVGHERHRTKICCPRKQTRRARALGGTSRPATVDMGLMLHRRPHRPQKAVAAPPAVVSSRRFESGSMLNSSSGSPATSRKGQLSPSSTTFRSREVIEDVEDSNARIDLAGNVSCARSQSRRRETRWNSLDVVFFQQACRAIRPD